MEAIGALRAMHTRSGLINEWEHGLSLDEAQAKVIAYDRLIMNTDACHPQRRRSPKSRPSNDACDPHT